MRIFNLNGCPQLGLDGEVRYTSKAPNYCRYRGTRRESLSNPRRKEQFPFKIMNSMLQLPRLTQGGLIFICAGSCVASRKYEDKVTPFYTPGSREPHAPHHLYSTLNCIELEDNDANTEEPGQPQRLIAQHPQDRQVSEQEGLSRCWSEHPMREGEHASFLSSSPDALLLNCLLFTFS